jgi:hypothetical protein
MQFLQQIYNVYFFLNEFNKKSICFVVFEAFQLYPI